MTGVHSEWATGVFHAVEELGSPIFALADPPANGTTIMAFGGKPCSQVTVRCAVAEGYIDVTTGRRPLGGTTNLVRSLLMSAVPAKPHLPWDVSLDERLTMLMVDDVRTQFRTVQASTGHWLAAGGRKKRHLLLSGSMGTSVDGLRLATLTLRLRAV